MLGVKREALSLLAYFDRPFSNPVPLLRVTRQLLARVVGDIEVKCTVHQGLNPLKPPKEERFLEEPFLNEHPENLLDESSFRYGELLHDCEYHLYNEPVDANRLEKYGVIEFDVRLQYRSYPVYDVLLPCYLRLDFVISRMDAEQHKRVVQVAIEFARQVASYKEFCSGLFDVADFYETSYGDEYSSIGIGWVLPQRVFNRYRWIMAGEERKHLARGVFWGNLLGPRMVEKLGDIEQLMNVLGEFRRGGVTDLFHRLPNGSLLILLSSDMRPFIPPYIGGGGASMVHARIAATLHRVLMERGLLIP